MGVLRGQKFEPNSKISENFSQQNLEKQKTNLKCEIKEF